MKLPRANLDVGQTCLENTEEICHHDTNFLLPPTNEVWGKVMLLRLFVCHSVHRGGVHPSMQWAGGFTVPWADPPPETATKAGGAHPTGIDSCFQDWFVPL